MVNDNTVHCPMVILFIRPNAYDFALTELTSWDKNAIFLLYLMGHRRHNKDSINFTKQLIYPHRSNTFHAVVFVIQALYSFILRRLQFPTTMLFSRFHENWAAVWSDLMINITRLSSSGTIYNDVDFPPVTSIDPIPLVELNTVVIINKLY
jgi:hypothetical protein